MVIMMLIQYGVVALIVSGIVGLFLFSLHFSKYRQDERHSGCCGGGHCDVDADGKIKHVHPVPDGHNCCKEE